MVDELLVNNGYNQQILEKMKKKKKKKRYNVQTTTSATLKIPYLSDQCTAEIKRAAQQYSIPVRVVTTPGRKLKDILTSSKPLDRAKCPNNKCVTCQCLVKGSCTASNVVYEITCQVSGCNSKYVGETYRPLHCRFIEHWRSAKNPTAQSYEDKPLAKHYTTHHPGLHPQLAIKIIERATSTNNRKIREARLIAQIKPEINDRNEQIEIRQYLI